MKETKKTKLGPQGNPDAEKIKKAMQKLQSMPSYKRDQENAEKNALTRISGHA